MHLPMYELIALPIAGKLAELLESQPENDFCADVRIIPPRGWRIHCLELVNGKAPNNYKPTIKGRFHMRQWFC